MEAMCADYWERWHAQVGCRSAWQEDCFDRFCSLSYMEGLHQYIKHRPALQCHALPQGSEAKEIEAEEERFLA
eukprot:6919336-Prorocentrum_lima.AAC.1